MNKLNLIGLGQTSSNIVDKIYKEDDCYKLSFRDNLLPEFINLEDNEKHFAKYYQIDVCKDISETFCFLDGEKGISGIILSLLENYKNNPITIFYIKKYTKNNTELLNQKITLNILQEYARSGLFKGIFIIDYDFVVNDLLLDLPDDQIINYNEVEMMFIDKVIFCAYSYWRLMYEKYIDGNKLDFEDTIYRIKTFFFIKNNSPVYLYNIFLPENFIYIKGIKSQMTKKEVLELQSFKEQVKNKNQNCIFISSENEFLLGIAESKIIQESNYI
jgi:hypothetical protein